MCRLIGFVSPAPTTLRDLVGDVQCSVFQNLSRLHADGWGTMWLENADPIDSGRIDSGRIATPGHGDERLTRAMTGVPTHARAVHLRMATDDMPVRVENSHPFVSDGIGLAHNGSIRPRELLLEGLDPEVLAGVKGDTDSELYLAWIRQGVRAGLALSAAVHEAVSYLRTRFPTASFNALVMSAEEFVVVHASSSAPAPADHFTGMGLSADQLPLDHLDAYYEMSWQQREDGAVAFSSTGINRDGWQPLPQESVTTVDLQSFAMTTRLLEPTLQAAS